MNGHFCSTQQQKMLEHWKALPWLALETISVQLGDYLVGSGGEHIKAAVKESIPPPSWVFKSKCDIWAAQVSVLSNHSLW